MEVEQLQDYINLQSDAVAIALIGVALLLILLLNRRRIQAAFREWRIQRCLDQIGCEQIRNFVCSDGLDGYFNIDRLALTQSTILLIAYKPYGGNIYCAERISEWTQVVERKSFKFENPLFELENQLMALKPLVNDAPLHGYLFFNHSALFPKGHPAAVLNPESIPDKFLNNRRDAVNPKILAAWTSLQQQQKLIEVNLEPEGKT